MEATLRLKDVERLSAAFLARATDGEFHDHDRQAQDNQKDEIQQHERAAAVFARNVWETPDVAQTDSAARGDEDEAQAGREVLALLLPACRLHGFRFSHCGYSLPNERG